MRNKVLTKIENIEKIAEKIAKIKNVEAVYLFGSYARGTSGPLSDIDLCVIGNLSLKEERDALSELSDNLDISFFNRLPIYIKIRVFKEGKMLIVNDKEAIDRRKFQTIQEYLDFMPLINKYIREVLHV